MHTWTASAPWPPACRWPGSIAKATPGATVTAARILKCETCTRCAGNGTTTLIKETHMGLKIYGIGASRASRPFWAALELDVPFEHINQSYKNSGTRTPEFLAINPNGHIPVVVDERPEGKVTVWESMACALYIARVHGKAESRLKVPLAVLEKHLQDQKARGESYLAANRFTVADLCVASVAAWVRPADHLLSQFPLTHHWLHQCLGRPAQKQSRSLGG